MNLPQLKAILITVILIAAYLFALNKGWDIGEKDGIAQGHLDYLLSITECNKSCNINDANARIYLKCLMRNK